MRLKSSVKISDETKLFLKKISINSIKLGFSEKFLSYSLSLNKIEKYFKLNNDEYIEMLKIEVDKDV